MEGFPAALMALMPETYLGSLIIGVGCAREGDVKVVSQGS